MIGYSEKKAEQLAHAVDRDMARIEDIAYTLRRRIPDTPNEWAAVDTLLEQFREQVMYPLLETIKRRQR